MVHKVSDLIHHYFQMLNIDRCTVSLKDLDEGDCIPWCEKHIEMLVQAFELGDLWDAYGIVGDIIVHLFIDLFFVY